MKIKIIIILLLIFFSNSIRAADAVITDELEKSNKGVIINLTQQIKKLQEAIENEFANDFVNYCTVLIAAGAIFYIGLSIIKSLRKGRMVDLNELVMPFLFIFIISSYRPLVKTIDILVSGFEYYVASKTSNIETELQSLRKQKVEIVDAINKKILDNIQKNKDGMFDKLISELERIWMDAKASLAMDHVANWFLMATMFLASFFIRITGCALGIFLYGVGPFAISISLFPVLRDSYKVWLSTYIWSQLFSPVAQLVSFILANVEKFSLVTDINRYQYILDNYSSKLTETIPNTFYSGMAYLAFMGTGAIMYFAIPTLASWIVKGEGGATLSLLNSIVSKTMAQSITHSKTAITELDKVLWNFVKH